MVSAAERDAMEPELESGTFSVLATDIPRTRWPNQMSDYQRLMVNPFLFVLVAIVFLLVDVALSGLRWPPMRLLVLFGLMFWLGLSSRLIQYHCLDCGETRPLRTWKRHACDAVLERAYFDERPWPIPPTPATQTKLWFLSLFMILIGYAAYLRS